MSRTVSLLVLALALALPGVAFAQDFDTAGEEAMLGRLNALRAENDLAPLLRAPELDAIARGHSADMASRNQLAHVSPHTGTPEERVQRAGIEAGMIAENVAMHRDTANAQTALFASPPHRTNMLSPDVTHVGIGSVRTGRGVFVTQLFISAPVDASEIPVPEVIEPDAAEQPSFELIPPFLEQALEDPAAALQNLPLENLPIDALPIAPEADDAEGCEIEEAPAPAIARPLRQATPRLTPNAAAPIDANAALRQLVDLANSFFSGY